MSIENEAIPEATHHPSPSRPRRQPPIGSCDTHFHVWGGDARERRNPKVPHWAPRQAPLAALNAMHAKLGIQRGVIVQNTVVDPDYDILLEHLAANPRLRAVALIDDQTTDAQLVRLDKGGVCGVRFHFARFMQHKHSPVDVLLRAVDRIAPLGWHVVLHVEPEHILEHGALFGSLKIPVVIDHMANMQYQGGLGQPGFRALLELQRRENVWIKLANADRWSVAGAPGYSDGLPFMKAVIDNGSDRLIWGSDWPHAIYKRPDALGGWPPPDDADLLNLLYDACSDDAALHRILVDNPATLFRF